MPASTVQRVFLGWDRPLVRAGAGFLAERAHAQHALRTLDLSNSLVVVPTARAGRLLEGALLDVARLRNLVLVPPRVLTPAAALEALAPVPDAAGEVHSQAAWRAALRGRGPSIARAVAHVPESTDWRGWWSLANWAARAHRWLTGQGHSFESIAAVETAGDASIRWRELAAVERSYREALSRCGLADEGLARRESMRVAMPAGAARVVLLGIADPPPVLRRALETLDADILALIAAPDASAALFDDLGAARPQWLHEPLRLEPDTWRVLADANEQADAVLDELALLNGNFGPDRIALAAPDAAFVPRLIERGARLGVRFRDAAGVRASRTRPGTLLALAAEYAGERSFDALGALVRHPDLPTQGSRSVASLDDYVLEHLPTQVEPAWLGDANDSQPARELAEACRALVDGLSGRDRPASAWMPACVEILARAYGREPGDGEAGEACAALLAAAREVASLQGSPSLDAPCGPREAVAMLLACADRAPLPELPISGSIDCLGWLEAPFDDAEVLLVAPMNEGFVPDGGDDHSELLTEARRRALGLVTGDERAARDAYLLRLIVNGRRRVRLLSARRGVGDEPLLPSRLLFSCGDDEALARARVWTPRADRQPAPPRRALVPGPVAPPTSGFPLMPRVDAPTPTSMRVTSFRDYLRSPYLFYLRHVLRVNEAGPRAMELDARRFGDLLHEAVRRFSLGPAANSSRERDVEGAVVEALESAAREWFGGDLPAPIWLQVQQAKGRLRGFAAWQADRTREGWTIERIEWAPEEGRASLSVDGEPMGLRGRIDRIDKHPDLGYQLLDYKTGDSVLPPSRVHGDAQKGWSDLQLPLYRYLARSVLVEGLPVQLGYIALPADQACKERIATWTSADLASADAAAEGVVRSVRRSDFGIAGDKPIAEGTIGALFGLSYLNADLGAAGEPEGDQAAEGDA